MQNLEAFRGLAELDLKVSLRIGLETVLGVSNSCDLAWIGLKSMHFRWGLRRCVMYDLCACVHV